MQLVTGDIKVRQIVVLLFDFDITVGEVFIFFLNLPKSLLELLSLVFNFFQFLGKLLELPVTFIMSGTGRCWSSILLTLRGDLEAEPLIFAQQLLSKFFRFG